MTEIRRENDFYPTPDWMVGLLLDHIDLSLEGGSGEHRGPRILEPCVGSGNIVNAILRRYPNASFLTNDIDERHPAVHHVDATNEDEPFWRSNPDWVITNPPFSAAFPILRPAFDAATEGVAMLLRLSWLEPTEEKRSWLHHNPPDKLIVMRRHSFDGASTDSVTAAWFVWGRHLTPEIIVEPFKGRQEGLAL